MRMTTEEFTQMATDWIASARHPRFNRPYTECVYQPMLELINYLKANDFEVYIVTGGAWSSFARGPNASMGIPLRRVIGSSLKTKFEMRDDQPY